MTLELVNDPQWIEFIGDRNVRSEDEAWAYLEKGVLASYERNGFGLYLVERKADRAALGMCGLVKRDTLPHEDLGFAFLPRFRGQGYALEAAAGTLRHARDVLGFRRLLAIATPANVRSAHLLQKLGFVRDPSLRAPGKDEVDVWAISLRAA